MATLGEHGNRQQKREQEEETNSKSFHTNSGQDWGCGVHNTRSGTLFQTKSADKSLFVLSISFSPMQCLSTSD
jgi:hypothetical protein